MAGTRPPQPEVKRTNPRIGIVALPASGRRGRTPAWPLDGRPSAAEHRLWRDLWRTPQAVAWERLGWTRVVARYARLVVLAEGGEKFAWPEARHLEDRLGLTPKAMRMLLWTVTVDEVGEARASGRRRAAPARRRLAAVDEDEEESG